MINTQRLTRKLTALSSKNVDTIVASNIFIPSLGTSYTKTQLTNWTKKFSDLLTQVQTNQYTDSQIQALRTVQYNKLSASYKLIADKIIGKQFYWFDLKHAQNRDILSLLILYQYITN